MNQKNVNFYKVAYTATSRPFWSPSLTFMSELPSSSSDSDQGTIAETVQPSPDAASPPDPSDPNLESPSEPKPSYVKLAMRNMVRKGSKSLFHFGLTTAGLLGILVGLAYLTR